MKNFIFILSLVFIFSCAKSDENPTIDSDAVFYFPSLAVDQWDTEDLDELGWNQVNVQPLLDYLDDKNTKGFIILHDGKIAIENYFNNHTQTSNWYWASAGKALTSLTVGIAQEENFLGIDNKTINYLGTNWTSLFSEKENLISIKNQLTMTTGLNETVFSCTDASCLTYVEDAGLRWAYHNGPYTLLQNVITQATGTDFEDYFNAKIRDKIGMNGVWIPSGFNNIYWSTTRSMARFGLLVSNKAKWDETVILNDLVYYNDMINTSQDFNKSYGYLWWLNGKSSFMLPGSQDEITGSIVPNAPDDMYMALGKNDQKIFIVPSKKLVVIRMGEDTEDTEFNNLLWEKINLVVGNE